MKKTPIAEINRAHNVTVLSISPLAEDHAHLEGILNKISPWALCPDSRWDVRRSYSLASAMAFLREERFPIVVCEGDLLPDWKKMLEQLAQVANSPFLIVTSRLADESLWADALNLGAYDVLAKPFDNREVVRVLSLAWLHWKEQQQTPERVEALGMSLAQ